MSPILITLVTATVVSGVDTTGNAHKVTPDVQKQDQNRAQMPDCFYVPATLKDFSIPQYHVGLYQSILPAEHLLYGARLMKTENEQYW